jgi:hypothetical protein
LKVNDNSEELAASIFKVEEHIKQEIGMNQAARNYFELVSCLAYLSTLNMEATYSSET